MPIWNNRHLRANPLALTSRLKFRPQPINSPTMRSVSLEATTRSVPIAYDETIVATSEPNTRES